MSLPGLTWREGGVSVLSGPLLDAFRRVDAVFAGWAAQSGAQEYRFPAFLPAAELDRLGYFGSFPQLVTFPAGLDPEDENLRRFASGPPLFEDGSIRVTELAPIRHVLTPAACYHFYVELAGSELDAARRVTTVSPCFRREKAYEPLRRQWSFTMREIVCLGAMEEVREFLSGYRERLTRLFAELDLPVAWENATDPFFDPGTNPKFLAQVLDPVKTEMVFSRDLAIGSINAHRNCFGEKFSIRRAGQPAFSGCVAFGIERWLFALIARFGEDFARWPPPFAPETA